MAVEPTDPVRPDPEQPEPLVYQALTPAERAAERRRRWGVWLVWVGAVSLPIVLLYLLVGTTPTSRTRPIGLRVMCASNLRQIGAAIEFHKTEHDGRYPSSFAELLQTQDISIDLFICPASNTSSPTTWPSAWPDACGDYIYLGSGLRSDVPGDIVVAYERVYEFHKGTTNVLFTDGRVVSLALDEFLIAFEKSDGLRRAWEQKRPK